MAEAQGADDRHGAGDDLLRFTGERPDQRFPLRREQDVAARVEHADMARLAEEVLRHRGRGRGQALDLMYGFIGRRVVVARQMAGGEEAEGRQQAPGIALGGEDEILQAAGDRDDPLLEEAAAGGRYPARHGLRADVVRHGSRLALLLLEGAGGLAHHGAGTFPTP